MDDMRHGRTRAGHKRRIVGVTLSVGDVSKSSLFVYCTGCSWYSDAKSYDDIATAWMEHTEPFFPKFESFES